MTKKKEPIAWITVNGAHVPIYDSSWMDSELKERYSRYIDDRSFDDRLDSDEKTWVEALRREKYGTAYQKEAQIEKSKQEADRLNELEKEKDKDKTLKPWSKAEEKRTKEASEMVMRYLYAGEDKEFMKFYETDGEIIHRQTLGKEYGTRDNVEATITKEHFIYAGNYDENERRVKKGKTVAGSTYYTVAVNEETIDDNVAGYKTQADAQHALNIYLDWMKNREKKGN